MRGWLENVEVGKAGMLEGWTGRVEAIHFSIQQQPTVYSIQYKSELRK